VPRIALLILVLALLAGGLWLLGGSRARREPASEPPRLGSGDTARSETDVLAPPAAAEDAVAAGARSGELAEEREDTGSLGKARAPALASDDLRVQVVDPARRAVAGLSLSVREADVLVSAEGTVSRATTDAEGMATFAGMRSFLLGRSAPSTLVHEVTFEEPPELQLTHALLDRDVVVSVLPPFGAIEVRASELDGTRARDTVIELSLVRRDEGRDPLSAFDRPSWSREAPGGVAHFPFVELGRDWSAAVRHSAFDVRSRADGPGPIGPGQVVVLDVVLGADHAVLALRAVDRAGRPFASARLTVERFEFFGGGQRVERDTDARGVFTVDRDLGWFFGGSLLVSHVAADGVVHSGFAELEAANEPGLHDGGDVVLEPASLLVAGRVVDERGSGVEGARVTAGASARYDPEPVETPEKDPFVFSWFSSSRFGQPQDVHGRSGPGGAFELQGQLPAGFVVWAQDRRARADPVEAGAGDRDLVLVLHGVWVVSGRVLRDPDAPIGELRLVQDGVDVASVATMDDEGSFRMEPVVSGLYDLVVRTEATELYRRTGIHVQGDTDLGAIDLTRTMHRHAITLLGGEAESLHGAYAWRSADAGGSEGWSQASFEGDGFEVWTPSPVIALRVAAAGYRQAELPRVSGSADVRLEEALRVRLLLRTTGTLPRFPYVFDPSLRLDELDVAWPEGSPYWTEENDEVVFRVATAGRLRVTWHLERRAEGMAVGGRVLGDHELALDVLDQPGEQVFVVELDGEALSALVAAPPF
jgi:hypothetical protein